MRCSKWIIANNKKGLTNSHSIYLFSHIVIMFIQADKHVVKASDRDIRNRRTMCLKLTIRHLNNSNEIVLESSFFKGATKMYFVHYLRVVMILLSTAICKTVFSPYHFIKLVFLFSCILIFCVSVWIQCQLKWLNNIYKISEHNRSCAL